MFCGLFFSPSHVHLRFTSKTAEKEQTPLSYSSLSHTHTIVAQNGSGRLLRLNPFLSELNETIKEGDRVTGMDGCKEMF